LIFPRRIYDLGLSHKAVAVYCYLANRADKNGECFPSVRRIAEDLSIHKSTVYRAFTELENRGLLNGSYPRRTPQLAVQDKGRDNKGRRWCGCLIGSATPLTG
jgi:DNA-binding MarR family transcriptional regulator